MGYIRTNIISVFRINTGLDIVSYIKKFYIYATVTVVPRNMFFRRKWVRFTKRLLSRVLTNQA